MSTLNKTELIEKTIRFYIEMESWDGPDFKESLREMAIRILAYAPTKLSQLFPGYSYVIPWTVTGPADLFDNLTYIQLILDEAKQIAIGELMHTESLTEA